MRYALVLLLFPLFTACISGAADKDSDDGGSSGTADDSSGGGGGGDSEEGCLTDTPTLRIGTGESEWIELEPGDNLMMIHGPQDGWHMLGSVWLEGTLPIIELSYNITRKSDGVGVSNNSYRVALVEEADCVGFYPGMFGFLHPPEGDAPDVLSYETLVLSMTAVDLEGRTASASLEVTAVPDPVDID